MLPLVFALLLGAQQAEARAPAADSLSDEQKERFLLEAEIVRVKDAPDGVTGSLRGTLRLADLTHDASIQSIDQEATSKALGHTHEVDFRDTYRNNVAAYRLDRLLGLRMVPPSVVRQFKDRKAAYTWWLDGLLMTEKERTRKKQPPPDTLSWNRQIWVLRVFDQLIFNFDRNLGNLLIDTEWRIWMIDHTRAFKIFKELKDKKSLPETCEAGLLAALRTLDKVTLEARMDGLLNGGQIEGLLGRRDAIVEHYDKLLASRGRERVLYELPRRKD